MDLDRFLPRDSALHRADPRVKLVGALAAILAIALLPFGAYVPLVAAWLALIVVALWAKVGAWRLARTGLVAVPFALAALPLIFTRTGDPLGSLVLGPLTLSISGEGLRVFTTVLLKSWLSVQVALLLAFSTPFHELIDALRELRMPRIMVVVIGFMYRYLGVLGDEVTRMSRARAARSAAAPGGGGSGGSLLWRAKVTGSMVGSLFIRSYERSERIIAAMQSRGFESELRHMAMSRPPGAQVLMLALMIVGLVAYVAVAHLLLAP